MGVHVDEMVSEVSGDADSPVAGSPQPATWEELARMQEARAQIARDRFRRAAENYDD